MELKILETLSNIYKRINESAISKIDFNNKNKALEKLNDYVRSSIQYYTEDKSDKLPAVIDGVEIIKPKDNNYVKYIFDYTATIFKNFDKIKVNKDEIEKAKDYIKGIKENVEKIAFLIKKIEKIHEKEGFATSYVELKNIEDNLHNILNLLQKEDLTDNDKLKLKDELLYLKGIFNLLGLSLKKFINKEYDKDEVGKKLSNKYSFIDGSEPILNEINKTLNSILLVSDNKGIKLNNFIEDNEYERIINFNNMDEAVEALTKGTFKRYLILYNDNAKENPINRVHKMLNFVADEYTKHHPIKDKEKKKEFVYNAFIRTFGSDGVTTDKAKEFLEKIEKSNIHNEKNDHKKDYLYKRFKLDEIASFPEDFDNFRKKLYGDFVNIKKIFDGLESTVINNIYGDNDKEILAYIKSLKNAFNNKYFNSIIEVYNNVYDKAEIIKKEDIEDDDIVEKLESNNIYIDSDESNLYIYRKLEDGKIEKMPIKKSIIGNMDFTEVLNLFKEVYDENLIKKANEKNKELKEKSDKDKFTNLEYKIIKLYRFACYLVPKELRFIFNKLKSSDYKGSLL